MENICFFVENVSKTAQYTYTKCRKWCKFQRRKSPWNWRKYLIFCWNVSKTAQYTDTKCRKWCKFQRRKSPVITLEKHEKNDKSLNFQTALNQSIKVQIVFWVVQKIAIDCFDPNPEIHEYRIYNSWTYRDFPCHNAFFDVFEKF